MMTDIPRVTSLRAMLTYELQSLDIRSPCLRTTSQRINKSCHWDKLLVLYAPQVRVDYVLLFGGEAQGVTREDLIGGSRKLLPGFTRTGHAAASVVAWHFVKEAELAGRDCWLVGGC
jgi:hypothetical protein